KLDWRQRILDFVRDSARDFAPRLHPFDLRYLADVLEEQHRSGRLAGGIAQRTSGHHQLGLAACDFELDGRAGLAGTGGKGEHVVEHAGQRERERSLVVASYDGGGAQIEQPLGARIDRGDDAVMVQPNDARRHVAQQGLGVLAPALEFGGGSAQIGSHLVEGIDQLPDLVVAYGGDAEIEIAAGDRLRPACERLDRAGDSARKKYSEPTRQRYHHQPDQHQRQQVAVHDGLAKNSQLEVVLGYPRNVGCARRQALRQIVVDQHRAKHVVGFARDVNRRRAADYVGAAEPVGASERLPLERLRDNRGIGRRADAGGGLWTDVDEQQFAIGGEHLDGAEVIFLLALGDERFELVALIRREQAIRRDLSRQHAGEMRRVVGRVQVVGLRDLERVIKNLLVLGIEPAVDVGVQEHARHVKQKRARDQCDGDESRDQPDLEFRTNQSAAALEDDLGEIASDQEQHQSEQQKAQVEERDDRQIGGQRGVTRERRQLGLREYERDQGRAGNADGDQLATAPLALCKPMRAYGFFRCQFVNASSARTAGSRRC